MCRACPKTLPLNEKSGKGFTSASEERRENGSFHGVRAKTKQSRFGFTLIEILLVVAFFALIGGMALIGSLDSYRSFSFHNERDTLIPLFFKARNQAATGMCMGGGCTGGKPHGVYFGTPHSYTLFQGANYTTRDAVVDEVFTAGNLDVAITHPSGLQEIVFAPLSATTSGFGAGSAPILGTTTWTLTIWDSAGHTSDVNFNSEGRIWWTH